MDVDQARIAVWSSAAIVTVVLLVACLTLYRWVGDRDARRPWFWSLAAVALFFSGPAVRALVLWRTASPGERIVPGLVATWAPAVVALAASLWLWWRLVAGRRSHAALSET